MNFFVDFNRFGYFNKNFMDFLSLNFIIKLTVKYEDKNYFNGLYQKFKS